MSKTLSIFYRKLYILCKTAQNAIAKAEKCLMEGLLREINYTASTGLLIEEFPIRKIAAMVRRKWKRTVLDVSAERELLLVLPL